MSVRRAVVVLWPWVLLFGCETGAVRIEDCRTVEYARCDAAEQCGTIEDAVVCRQFYRDQCLHGLPLDSDVIIRSQVQDCANAIEAAGDCAEADGPNAPLARCADAVSDADPSVGGSACELVSRPERYVAACAFLLARLSDGGVER